MKCLRLLFADKFGQAMTGQGHQKLLVEPLRDLRPEGRRDLYGLCSPKIDQNKCFDYGIGVIIDEETSIADQNALISQGYRVWETEPAEYAVFPCIGTDGDCIAQAWSRFYKEFLPQSGYVQTELTDYEIYYENREENLFCELWIPVERPGQ